MPTTVSPPISSHPRDLVLLHKEADVLVKNGLAWKPFLHKLIVNADKHAPPE